MPVVFDATIPCDEYVMGPGHPTKRSHAFQPGSYVSLCGRIRTGNEPAGHSEPCPRCLELAGLKAR